MKLVLNIGMHKTGSSSIQQSLAKFERDGAVYMQVGHPNHSGLMFTAFSPTADRHQSHVKNGRTPEEVAELRNTFRAKMATFCEDAAARGCHTLMASAEDVSLLDIDGVTAVRDFFAQLVDEILIVGYVRPPASFMRSALQQRVVGARKIDFAQLYPVFRDRFEKFDTVFGRDAVRLKKFDRALLKNGDVVADFAEAAGVDLDPSEVVLTNESRTLEATAILYAQRKLGRGHDRYPGAVQDNHRLVTALSGIGDGKIHLDPSVVQPLIDAHADDLAWMSQRLGCEIADTPEPHPEALLSPDDLLDVAGKQMPALMQRIAQEMPDCAVDPLLVARALDLFHDILRTERETRPRGARNRRRQDT